MFQYAALRAIELRTNYTCKLDISSFKKYSLHQGFELDKIFSMPISFASKSDLRSILGWQANSNIRNKLLNPSLKFLRSNNFILESDKNFLAGTFQPMDGSYLSGYWQSEKYFQDFRSLIRKDFSFSSELCGLNLDVASKINSTNSISLHIRRGDYVANQRSFAIHGVCSLEYYHSAMERIQEKVDFPTYFIFSDDLEWARENLKTKFPSVYVEHNKESQSYNDMRLMSLCKHHIIANSSFSWWGAWLNPSGVKIVISPKRWYADKSRTIDNLIPKSWVQI